MPSERQQNFMTKLVTKTVSFIFHVFAKSAHVDGLLLDILFFTLSSSSCMTLNLLIFVIKLGCDSWVSHSVTKRIVLNFLF